MVTYLTIGGKNVNKLIFKIFSFFTFSAKADFHPYFYFDFNKIFYHYLNTFIIKFECQI